MYDERDRVVSVTIFVPVPSRWPLVTSGRVVGGEDGARSIQEAARVVAGFHSPSRISVSQRVTLASRLLETHRAVVLLHSVRLAMPWMVRWSTMRTPSSKGRSSRRKVAHVRAEEEGGSESVGVGSDLAFPSREARRRLPR